MMNYGIDIWGNDNFIIKNGKVCINHEKKPAIIDIVKELRDDGYKGPLLLRFPHLIQKFWDINFIHSTKINSLSFF